MGGRQYNSTSYRFGFNGKEKDNEISGSGNQYDYGFRIYNPRLGKFLSVDPLAQSYPFLTPYQFAENQPIWGIDLDGLELLIVTDGTSPGVDIYGHEIKISKDDYLEVYAIAKNGMVYAMEGEVQIPVIEGCITKWAINGQMYNTVYDKSKGDIFVELGLFDMQWTTDRDYWTYERQMNIEYQRHLAQTMQSMDQYGVGFSGILVGGACLPLALQGGGILAEAAWYNKLSNTFYSGAIQYGTRGEVDIIDALADGCLTPGASAYFGATMDLSLNEGKVELNLLGINKSSEQFMAEFTNSMIWGYTFDGLGNAASSGLESVGGSSSGEAIINLVGNSGSIAGEQCVEEYCIEN